MSLHLFTPPDSASDPFLSFKTKSACGGDLTCSGLPLRGPPCWARTRGSRTHRRRCWARSGAFLGGNQRPHRPGLTLTRDQWSLLRAAATGRKAPPPVPGRAQAQSPSSSLLPLAHGCRSRVRLHTEHFSCTAWTRGEQPAPQEPAAGSLEGLPCSHPRPPLGALQSPTENHFACFISSVSSAFYSQLSPRKAPRGNSPCTASCRPASHKRTRLVGCWTLAAPRGHPEPASLCPVWGTSTS